MMRPLARSADRPGAASPVQVRAASSPPPKARGHLFCCSDAAADQARIHL